MKSFFATLLFCCFATAGYSQTTFASPRGVQSQKNPISTGSAGKNYLTNYGVNCGSKSNQQNVPNSYKPDVSVISVIPTLRLWLLPANLPNPFVKDDE